MKPLATPAAHKAARKLRRCSTDSERYLWLALRDRRLDGLKFRRQHPVGPYVLDFYCNELSLAIEIDGAYHDFTSKRDTQRQRDLEAMGIRFIRVAADDVETQREAVVNYIRSRIAALTALTPSPSLTDCPSPSGRGARGEGPRPGRGQAPPPDSPHLDPQPTDCPSPSRRGVRGEGPHPGREQAPPPDSPHLDPQPTDCPSPSRRGVRGEGPHPGREQTPPPDGLHFDPQPTACPSPSGRGVRGEGP